MPASPENWPAACDVNHRPNRAAVRPGNEMRAKKQMTATGYIEIAPASEGQDWAEMPGKACRIGGSFVRAACLLAGLARSQTCR
jgi:hypothetical protein